MNYNYEEWQRIKENGIIKFVFDVKNLTLIFLLVTVFAVTNLLTRKIITSSKELMIHFTIIIVILIILWMLTQLIKWKSYKNIFENNSKIKPSLIKLYELLIGILNIWIPIGILTSTYGIDYGSAIWKIDHVNINYVLRFIIYISVKSTLWVISGILFELFIINTDIRHNKKGVENFIIINKYI